MTPFGASYEPCRERLLRQDTAYSTHGMYLAHLSCPGSLSTSARATYCGRRGLPRNRPSMAVHVGGHPRHPRRPRLRWGTTEKNATRHRPFTLIASRGSALHRPTTSIDIVLSSRTDLSIHAANHVATRGLSPPLIRGANRSRHPRPGPSARDRRPVGQDHRHGVGQVWHKQYVGLIFQKLGQPGTL